ncbi:hypothetical protein ACFQZZ_11690 [Nocardia sp. GCM10030253]|uniref:hypothetical protein n=1 Tax=Nocardia sp. GCM10030253 TaxID=3273404 RepID=UPI003639AD53
MPSRAVTEQQDRAEVPAERGHSAEPDQPDNHADSADQSDDQRIIRRHSPG